MKYKGKEIKLINRKAREGLEPHSCTDCVIFDSAEMHDSKYCNICAKDTTENMFIFKEEESADSVSQNETVDERLEVEHQENLKQVDILDKQFKAKELGIAEGIAKAADKSFNDRIALLEWKVEVLTNYILKE